MDVKSNFWKVNPEYEVVYDAEFVKMSDSSNIMWAIYLWCDPRALTAMEYDDASRLEHIRKRHFPEFDPLDPFTAEQISKYLKLVPEPETAYFDLLKEVTSLLTFYKGIIPVTVRDANDKAKGIKEMVPIFDNLTKKRKELAVSRMASGDKGIGSYVPSRVESGRSGSAAS